MGNVQVATSLTRKLCVTSVASCTFFQQKSQDWQTDIKNIDREGLTDHNERMYSYNLL
jgi:hypothetical protein